jgi:hypothetical protein
VILISKLVHTLKTRSRALYVTMAIAALAAVALPAAAFATEGSGPAEPSTSNATVIVGEGSKGLIGFFWAILPYLIGVAIVMLIVRWLMKKFGWSTR